MIGIVGSNPTLSANDMAVDRPGRSSDMRNAGHKFDPSLRHRLCSRERLRRLPPLKILRRLGLKRGGVLVDIGCGTGFFALPAARLVGREGKVYGLDISPDMLADMMSAAARMRISNLVPVASSRDGRGIPPRASLYFLGNVFHEVEDKRTYLRRLSRRMGRDSRLAILDHHKKKTIHGPPQAPDPPSAWH